MTCSGTTPETIIFKLHDFRKMSWQIPLIILKNNKVMAWWQWWWVSRSLPGAQSCQSLESLAGGWRQVLPRCLLCPLLRVVARRIRPAAQHSPLALDTLTWNYLRWEKGKERWLEMWTEQICNILNLLHPLLRQCTYSLIQVWEQWSDNTAYPWTAGRSSVSLPEVKWSVFSLASGREEKALQREPGMQKSEKLVMIRKG